MRDACGEQAVGGRRQGVEKSAAEYCRSYFSSSTSAPRFRVSRVPPATARNIRSRNEARVSAVRGVYFTCLFPVSAYNVTARYIARAHPSEYTYRV
jgi:hypothetical protein